MNYLAHAFLSCSNADILLGNFIADYINVKDDHEYSDGIRKGIEIHRKIDFYTDNHPIVRKGTKRLRPNQHKYAPVVIDILYDYILSANWSRYSGEKLQDFADGVYDIFLNNKSLMPSKLKERIDHMIEDNFLLLYSSDQGLMKSLNYMDRRTKFPSNFSRALNDLKEDWDLFNDEFNLFFPDVIKLVENECGC